MPGNEAQEITCSNCGHRYPAGAAGCPACGEAAGTAGTVTDVSSEWARTRDGLKTKWVAAVVAFWVSAVVLLAVFLIDGRLDLILSSVALGLLFIGMWLKARYQLHLRKEPTKH